MSDKKVSLDPKVLEALLRAVAEKLEQPEAVPSSRSFFASTAFSNHSPPTPLPNPSSASSFPLSSASGISSSSLSVPALTPFIGKTKNSISPFIGKTKNSTSPFIGKTNNSTKEQYPSFERKVILLKDCTSRNLQPEEVYREDKFICDLITFQKSWNLQQILDKIYSVFIKQLPMPYKMQLKRESKLELLQVVGSQLSEFVLEPGAEMTGMNLAKVSKKVLYVRADHDFHEEVTEPIAEGRASPFHDPLEGPSTNEPDAVSDSENWFLPKKSKAGVKRKPTYTFDSSSDEDAAAPKKLGNWYVDEDGKKHFLVDVNPQELSSSTQMNIQKIPAVIRICRGKLTSRTSYLTLNRNSVLNTLLSEIQNPLFALSNINVTFVNENGVGSGLLREMFTLALNEIKLSHLFEGNEFMKTMKRSVISLRDGEYVKFGEIISLAIVHGSVSPCFFSKVAFELIFDIFEEGTSLNLSDILNENVKNEIKSVQEANSCYAVNRALADTTIFDAASTYEQVNSSNWEEEKEIAIKDAIKFYAVERIREPAQKLAEGLNKNFKLMDLLKTCNLKEVRNMFVYNHDACLTAESVKGSFKVSATDEKSKAYKHFVKYLQHLESEDNESQIKLKDVLHYATSQYDIPPLGYGYGREPYITLMPYLMPQGKSCFNQLILPTLNETYEDFKLNFDLALEFGGSFGMA